MKESALRFTIVLMILLAAFRLSARADTVDRPNIVLVLVDDLRWDALGCTGHPFVETPNIDRLATEGAVFRNAFVATPLCLPSRATMLTGLYAHAHGVTFGAPANDPGDRLLTFPQTLQRAEYDTAFLGKWHIGLVADPRPGFSHWVSFRDQGEYDNPQLNIDGEIVNEIGYMTDILTDRATRFLDRPRSAPFFLLLSHKGVHAPFQPAERHRTKYRTKVLTPPESASDSLSGKPALRRPGVTLRSDGTDPDVQTTDEMIRNQLRCLLSIDESVGRIVEKLREKKLLDETLIIFTSDNGYFWGEHGLGGKHGPYEEAIRVPLIVRYPKRVDPGTLIDDLVLNVDLAPTMLEAAGLLPAASGHGSSFLPLFGDKPVKWRQSFMAEYQLNDGQTPRFPTWRAVRSKRWKYVHYPDHRDMDELYDLQNDRFEMVNLINEPSSTDTASRMRTELRRLMEASDDPLSKAKTSSSLLR